MDPKQLNTIYKSELRRGKKWSFAGVRSGTFGAPKGEEKTQYVDKKRDAT